MWGYAAHIGECESRRPTRRRDAINQGLVSGPRMLVSTGGIAAVGQYEPVQWQAQCGRPQEAASVSI
jgi:hypothetical protein